MSKNIRLSDLRVVLSIAPADAFERPVRALLHDDDS